MRRKILIVFIVAVVFLGSRFFIVAEAAEEPTNFTAIATSSCAILLEWEDTINLAETTYDVKRGVVVAPEVVTKEDDNSLYFIFIDRHDNSLWGISIDPDDSHAYSVRANNNITPTQTVWVGPESATTFSLPSQPGQPINTTSTVYDNEDIEISWATSTVGSVYFNEYGGLEIWLATSSDGSVYTSFSQIDRVPGDTSGIGHFLNGKFFYRTASNDKDLSYQYKIRIQEVGGLGCDYTRPQHVALSDYSTTLTIPRRPGNLDAQFVSEQSKITLTWNDTQHDPNNESGFEIHRAEDSGFSSYQQLGAGIDWVEYNDMDIVLNPPVTYY
ncbi:MAG: hypothetical protein IID32_08335, partial [Planctomycetes bacterium]|nr:hypothetical protein [Planctomycetota bacterium]